LSSRDSLEAVDEDPHPAGSRDFRAIGGHRVVLKRRYELLTEAMAGPDTPGSDPGMSISDIAEGQSRFNG
jgi:hypothetical protein